MSHAEETDKAVAELLSVDSKLGILAGLTLVAKRQQEQQSEDEDAVGSPTDHPREASSRKTSTTTQQRRHGSVLVGARSADLAVASADTTAASSLSTGSTASTSTPKKYSVHDQRDAIRKLHAQNQILKQELAIEARDAKTMLGLDKRQQLTQLQTTAAAFTHKLAAVKRHVARVDELLVSRTHELATIRQQQQQQQQHSEASLPSSSSLATSDSSAAVTSVANAMSAAASTRRLRALENRLELALVKKNEMESVTKHLRAQLESVRKDRVIFDSIYKKLERETSDATQRHALATDDLARATDATERVHAELEKIETQAAEEQRAYEQAFQSRKAAIEVALRDATRLSDGGVGVSVASPFPRTDAVGTTESSPLGVSASHTGSATAKDSPLTRVAALSSWKIGYDRALATTAETAVRSYDRTFASITALTGIPDIATLAAEIVRRDDANFVRFKRVEALHDDEAALLTQIDALTTHVATAQAQDGLATSATQRAQSRVVADALAKAVDTSHTLDCAIDDTTATLARLKSSVHSIHSMLAHASCARTVDAFSQGSAHLTLGSHSARDVTDANVLEYVQAIETFTTSLMKATHDAAAAASATATVDTGASAAGDVNAAASTPDMSAGAGDQDLAACSPIGHGPPTLPFDPTQKLHVHVPSFGGVNGVLIVPASSPFSSSGEPIKGGSSTKPLASPLKSLQQQQQTQTQTQHLLHQGLQRRKSNSRFELTARKSLSQMQFVAALAASAASTSDAPLSVLHALGSDGSRDTKATGTSGSASAIDIDSPLARARLEEEEEERALTYDELRQFAAKNVVKRTSDAVLVEASKDHA